MAKLTSFLFGSLAMGPAITLAADTCFLVNNGLFFSYTVNLDTTSCNDQGNFFTTVTSSSGCNGLTGNKCNQVGDTAAFTFNEIVFCGESQMEDVIRKFDGRSLQCSS